MNLPFSEKEVENIRIMPGMFGGPDYPEFDYPVSHKENYVANMEGRGYWVPTANDVIWFCPTVFPDNAAKGNVHETLKVSKDQLGGKDMFGIDWEYVPHVGGSTVRPGAPLLKNVNDWKKTIKFPDINTWDWEGCAKRNTDYLAGSGRLVNTVICTGWFERLISFMDFSEAAVAMIDDEQRDALGELFESLTDLYIKIVDKFLEYFPGLIHGITMHDDWAAQRAPFFSPGVVEEVLFAPHKRMAEYIRQKGLYADFHCCGAIDMLLPNIAKIGYDRIEVMPLVNRENFYANYGSSMMLTYTPDAPPENATEEDYKRAARNFVDKFFNKGTKCILETYYQPMPVEFLKELYVYSRKKSSSFYTP
jgi:hypothetical protein